MRISDWSSGVCSSDLIGALATAVRRPSIGFQSGVQHLAAGVVFAAAAGEILPDLKHSSSLLPVLLGAAVGIAGMLALKSSEERSVGKGCVSTCRSGWARDH